MECQPAPIHFTELRWVGYNGTKGFIIAKMRISQSIIQSNIELVVVDVVHKHVHRLGLLRNSYHHQASLRH
jgi:hypothetical protein